MKSIGNLMKVSRLTKVEVLLCLSVLKSPHAKWIVEIYNDMTTPKFKDVIANGWKSSGITEALKSGKNDFGDLGLFSDTELLLDSTPHSPHSPDVGQQIPSAAETEMIGYKRSDFNDDDEKEIWEDPNEGDSIDRNIFDILDDGNEE